MSPVNACARCTTSSILELDPRGSQSLNPVSSNGVSCFQHLTSLAPASVGGIMADMKPVLIALSAFSVCLPYAGADIRNEPPIPSRPDYAKTIEAAIRIELKKPTGELIKADLDKVLSLN